MENLSMTKKEKILGPRENHAFGEFIQNGTKRMIIGSFPIGKFTNPERASEIDHEKEIMFFYGGAKNKLWQMIGTCYDVPMNTVDEIKNLLTSEGIGVADVVKSCCRINGSALDKDLKEIEWNKDLLNLLRENQIEELIFTSKVVRNWFEKHIGSISEFKETVLISPSGAAMISVAASPAYKAWSLENPDKRPMDYRALCYKEVFSRSK